jgi:hypothetical protein
MSLKINTATSVTIAVAMVLGGCSGTVAEPTGTVEQKQTLAPITVPGHVHSLSQSAFRIGANVGVEVNLPTLQRWRGDNGAFALDPTNGWTMALLDANTPRGPYILDANDQALRVNSYFVSAGVPAEQISDVATTFHAEGSAQMGNGAPSPALESLNSILRRSISGIPVPDSYAWAKMTTSGQVDMESVFWPPIDSSVVASALALAQSLNDATSQAAFMAKLPRVYKTAGVVIHHSDLSIHSAPTAFVSFDATIGSEATAAMHHFDPAGQEFRLPQELTAAPQPPRPVPANP